MPDTRRDPYQTETALANKLRNESLKTSNSIVAVTELIERVVASMGHEEGLARYMGALLTYLWPNASDDDKSASVQSFYEIYIPYFQLPFAKYLKKHFAMAC